MKTLFKLAMSGFILSLISTSVYASNFHFLGNSAITYFSKEDIKLFKVAEKKALNQVKDGVKVAWRNSHTGSHGYFVPLRTSMNDGVNCRDVKMFNSAHLINGKAVFKFCKLNDQWKIV